MSKSNKKKKYRYGMDRRTQFQLQAMMLPATLLVLLFCIVPLFGILIAFKDYRPVSGVAGIFTSPWNNFKNFEIVRQYKKRLGKGSIYAGYFYNVYKFLWQYHEYLFE